MKRAYGFLFTATFCFLLLPALSYPTTRGLIKVVDKHGQSLPLYRDYQALVVGISDYDWWPKLPNATNDAREVAQKLKALGFKVKLVIDPTSREMRTLLNEMVYQMGNEKARALLFYYAGHGETETLADKTKMGYIIPKDCPLLERNALGFGTHAISMRDIESISLRIKARHVLMLFDSCFSGALFSLVRAVPAAITEKSALSVRQYITAGREDEQVPDKSMFKRCLLIGLEGDADLTGDGYITGSELGMYLSEKVVNYTHRRQHPQYGKINNPDLDRGDFIFIPPQTHQIVAAVGKGRPRATQVPAEKMNPPMSEPVSMTPKIETRKRQKKSSPGQNPLELKLKESERRLQEEAAKVRALKEELKRIKSEMQKKSPEPTMPVKSKKAGEKRLAYIPKEVKDLKTGQIKLRQTQKTLFPRDIKKMIKTYNFCVRPFNENGDFPNDFVDNDDGTITDRVTGLMWQKGGSPKLYHFYEAKEYVEGLNKRKLAGYKDWRIPTLEELCSLLEPEKNQAGLHMPPIFDAGQPVYLNVDLPGGAHYLESCGLYHAVDFKRGSIGEVATTDEPWCDTPFIFYVKAVRTTKSNTLQRSQF